MECKHNTAFSRGGAHIPGRAATTRPHRAPPPSRLTLVSRGARNPLLVSPHRKKKKGAVSAPTIAMCVIIKKRGLSNKKRVGWGGPQGVGRPARSAAVVHFCCCLVVCQNCAFRCNQNSLSVATLCTSNPMFSSLTSGGPARSCPAPAPPSQSRAARRPSPRDRTGRWRRRRRSWPAGQRPQHPTCPV